MGMTEAERADLAPLIAERRASRYGTKRAAYTEAGVNPMTWDRAEAGETVRDDLMRKIVRVLWPASDGDWRRIAEQEQSGVDHEELRALIRETVREMLRDSGGRD